MWNYDTDSNFEIRSSEYHAKKTIVIVLTQIFITRELQTIFSIELVVNYFIIVNWSLNADHYKINFKTKVSHKIYEFTLYIRYCGERFWSIF